MKKIVFALALGFLFVACDPVDRDIKRLEQIAAEAQTQGESYSMEQWEAALNEYESISEDLKKRQDNLNVDDISRISKASIAFTNQLMMHTTRQLLDEDSKLNEDIEDYLERVGEAPDEEYLSSVSNEDYDD